uniref:THAP-type domain-containing protein n=1 Tax=Ixodes ricinus TaxID=34613 RepID=A0A6B0UZK2_IXORI
MPRTCAAESCFKNFSLCEMPCHKFPKDEKLSALWSRLARPSFPTWVPTNIDRLCGYHFSDEDYIWNPKLMKSAGLSTKNMRLKPGVVPSVFSKKGSSDQLTRPLEKRSEAAPLFDATDVLIQDADACRDTQYKAAESPVSPALSVVTASTWTGSPHTPTGTLVDECALWTVLGPASGGGRANPA